MEFEVSQKDLMGRIGWLKTPHGVIETPAVLPVINPNYLSDRGAVTPRELYEKFGFRMIITNSYIILKSDILKEKSLERGLHQMLDYPGAIMTDSGTFQSYVYGKEEVEPERIVEFQRLIGSDIGTILDVFTTPKASREEAVQGIEKTLQRARASREVAGDMTLAVPLQGGMYTDLRKNAALQITAFRAQYVPIGGIVPLMESYRYKELFEIIFAAEAGLSRGVPVHLFGAGHPSLLPFAVALGVDIFDSASYIKYARDGRYLTEFSTKNIDVLTDFPCNCPICSSMDPDELKNMDKDEREGYLARHNLYIIQKVIREVKQSLREGTLWEMLERYGRAHPKLWEAFLFLGEKWNEIEKLDPLYKRRVFIFSKVSKAQPVYRRAVDRLLKRYSPISEPVGVIIKKENIFRAYMKYLNKGYSDKELLLPSPYGPLPAHLFEIFPFGQTISEDTHSNTELLKKYRSIEEAESPPEDAQEGWWNMRFLYGALQIQFGKDVPEVLFGSVENAMKKVKVKRSKNTGRARTITFDDEHFFGVKASDGFFTLSPLSAEHLLKAFPSPRFRVVVSDESAPFNKDGKSVFPPFVIDIDTELRPGDEVMVVDKEDNLLAIGKMLLSPREVGEMKRGIAVKVREGVKGKIL